MELIRRLLLLTAVVIALNSDNVRGRYHYHKPKNKSGSSPSTPPPVPVPVPSSPVTNPPSVPSDPYPGDTPGDSDSGCIFDVTKYGAVGDGETDDTAAFRAAWKEACSVESGVVLAPSDYSFMITSTIFSGPCKPGLVFQLDGCLMPPDGPESWPEKDSKKQWLVFYRLDDMTFTGKGIIEGNGEKWWDLPCKPHRGPNGESSSGPCDSPALIRFFMSSNIVVKGLKIQNSPQFHMKFDGCEGVMIQELAISSPKLSPNTDGIHLENTKSVGIYNSMISNEKVYLSVNISGHTRLWSGNEPSCAHFSPIRGDDCISIGTGCSNVDIQGLTCGPSHGISIGSLGVHNSQACVSNITVSNAIIRDSDNGVRIKTWQGGTGSVSAISFQNIQMENVRNCIIIDQYYCMSKACLNQTSAVFVTDVSFNNIKGTYDVRTPPIHFACSDSVPCTNITLSEVELLPEEGELVDDPFCWNAYGVEETVTIPPLNCLREGQPQDVQETAAYGC